MLCPSNKREQMVQGKSGQTEAWWEDPGLVRKRLGGHYIRVPPHSALSKLIESMLSFR